MKYLICYKNIKSIRQTLITLFRLFCVIVVFAFFVLIKSISVHADNGDTIVHITATGSCYHNAGCRSLHSSDYEVTLYEAVVENGYNPCEVCHPPIYDGPAELHEPMEKPQGGGGGTNSGSNNGSGNSTSNNSNNNTHTTNNSSNNRNTYDSDKKPGWIACAFGIGIAFFLPGCLIICEVYSKIQSAKEYAINKKQKKEEFERSRQMYYSMYAGKTPISIVQVPPGAFVRDNLPCTTEKQNKPYGDYTVYVGKNAQVLRMNPRCGGADLNPVNYSLVCRLPHCKRCATGNITLPRLEWFLKYSEIESIKRKYNIP